MMEMSPPSPPPPGAGDVSFRATRPLVPAQRVYQAIPATTASSGPYSRRSELNWPLPSSRGPPFRVVRRRSGGLRGFNLAQTCMLVSAVTRKVLFNTSSAVLGVLGALFAWSGALLALLTLPICGLGVLIFHALVQLVFYLCCADAFIYNALAATAADCIDMDNVLDGAEAAEMHPLLPVRVLPPPGSRTADTFFQPCPRFEASLAVTSPRSVLALVYFGSFKLVVAAVQATAVGLLLGVLGFLMSDSRVPSRLEASKSEHPFIAYTAAFVLLLTALALLHGTTHVSKRVTRFFCCEAEVQEIAVR